MFDNPYYWQHILDDNEIKLRNIPEIRKVIFNYPATVVLW